MQRSLLCLLSQGVAPLNKTSGLTLTNVKYKTIIKSTFKNLVCDYEAIAGPSGGGALQIVEQDIIKDPSNFLLI